MIKLIVIGAGKWGRNHIRTAYELGVLGGVVDSNKESLAFVKKEYPDVAVFQSLDDDGVLAFDAFSVAVPAAAHFEVAKFLLEHKKHENLKTSKVMKNGEDARRKMIKILLMNSST